MVVKTRFTFGRPNTCTIKANIRKAFVVIGMRVISAQMDHIAIECARLRLTSIGNCRCGHVALIDHHIIVWRMTIDIQMLPVVSCFEKNNHQSVTWPVTGFNG